MIAGGGDQFVEDAFFVRFAGLVVSQGDGLNEFASCV